MRQFPELRCHLMVALFGIILGEDIHSIVHHLATIKF